MKTIYSAVVVLFLTAAALNAQMVTQQWVQLYNSGLIDNTEKMVMDNSGNVHVVGERRTNGGYPFQFYAKYGSNGTFLHQRFLTPPYNSANFRGCYALDVTVDNGGNAFVCGYLDSAFGLYKGYIIKYNSSGDSVIGMYAGINDTLQYVSWVSVKTDNSGNIYTAGYNYTANPYNPYYLLAKYNSAGSVIWIKRYKPAQYYAIGYTLSMELDNSGNIIVASTMQKNSLSSSTDFHVFKFNNSGTFQWSATYNGPQDAQDELTDLALDGSGNAYVEGLVYAGVTNKEIACIKYNGSTGAQEWIYRTGGTNNSTGDDKARNMAVSSLNEVYITGYLYNLNSYEDGFLIKLNTSGSEVWRKAIISTTGSSYDITDDVAVDNAGYVYALGLTQGYSTQSKAVIPAYNSNGDSLWSTSYMDPTMSLFARNISIKGGSIAIACDHNNTTTGDVTIVKYSHTTAVHNIGSEIPNNFSLSQNYPNPFNPVTIIKFEIAKEGFVKLTVFDITGKVIETLVSGNMNAGVYNADFSASKLSTGVYFYRLETEDFTDVKKMVLIK
jgi:hypothetical protein